jgi:glycerol uptake facilitator-like aquaporin
VPFYIIAQILGAFCACLIAYWQYRQQFVEITAAMVAGGKGAAVFSPAGVSAPRAAGVASAQAPY